MMDQQTSSAPPRKPSHPVWRMIKIAVGLALLALGFVGLFLPLLQGVLFMLLGLAVLGTESRRVRRLLDAIKQRHPGPWRRARVWKRRLSAWAALFTSKGKEASSDEGARGPAD